MTRAVRPSVAVIAPLHDASEFVEAMVAQLRATLADGDLAIVVDDASTDDTLDAVRAAVGDDRRFLVLANESNLGVARSRNRALEHATQDLVWFVDHDDEWEPDVLDRLCGAIGDADIAFARADYRTDAAVPGRIVDGVDRADTVSAGQALELMLLGRVHGYLWSKLFRREVLGNDPFPPLSSQSDFCAVVTAVARAGSVRLLPDLVYHYLRREGSITRGKAVAFDNFVAARAAMHAAAEAVGIAQRDPGLLAWFDSWFFAHALAFVPVRQGSPVHVRREGFARARAAANGIPLAPLLRRGWRTAGEMALIRAGRVPYTLATVASLRVFDAMRAARVRARAVRR